MDEEVAWFLVVNRQGRELAGLRTAVVSDGMSVGEFLKAAYRVCSSWLPLSLSPLDLTVFPNKVAHLSESSMKLADKLGDLGKNPAGPLIVRVPEVWFQLVDASTRDVFPGSSEHLAFLREEGVAAELRRIVRKVFPYTFPESAVIKIYKNRQAYVTKEEEMHGDENIGSFGKTKSTALVVEVPSFTSNKSAPKHSVLGPRGFDHKGGNLHNEPPPKRSRLRQSRLTTAGPVIEGHFSVPMETIAAFQTIKDGFSDTSSLERPLFVLHGPRKFGKSTITYAIEMWLTTGVLDVVCASIQLMLLHTDSDNVFWNVMGKTVDRQSSCADSTSFMNMVKIHTGVTKKRVCFILDALLEKSALMVASIAVLRQLEASSCFCGYLGVSRHDLGRHCDFGPGNLYKEVNLLKAEPFSTGQMAAFFELIEHRFDFTKSLRCAIMQSSSGAPGVFGSMVRLTVDHAKWTKEGCEWDVVQANY